MTLPPVQMLWIGGRLSNLERLAIASFLANGHAVHLYTYGRVDGVPAGAILRDGREILPETAIFTYADGMGRGSPSAFSNMFRYKLLFDRGGIWCDTDVVCLAPLTFALEAPLWTATERLPPHAGDAPDAARANGCYLQAPAGDPLVRECYETCAAADKQAMRWGDTGPKLITRMFKERGLERHALAADVICPLDWWNVPSFVQAPFVAPSHSFCVHLWNEMWRQRPLDKDGRYPAHSGYETLKRRYAVE